jgi:hypothetical protein
MRKLDWKQDGSDLMDEAEIYYLEAINTHRWGRKAYKQDVQYAFKATSSETETKEEKEKPKNNSYEEMIKALTAQLLTLQDGVAQMQTLNKTWTRNMHGRECHQRVENHQQRECTQMERTRSTIGAHIIINGPSIPQQNARD